MLCSLCGVAARSLGPVMRCKLMTECVCVRACTREANGGACAVRARAAANVSFVVVVVVCMH